MNIAVCVKRVPKTAEADILIEKDGKDIRKDHLVFALNDWDAYAVREAVRLKEQHGGTVTVISVGPDACKEILTRCLAMEADRALRIEAPVSSDPHLTGRTLCEALRNESFDLILTGVQAEDDNFGQVGGALAGMMGLPHAAIVNRIEIEGAQARVRRELEGGIEEVLDVPLPVLLTVQSGINEPKYVSLSAILEAEDKEMKDIALEQIGIGPGELLDMTVDAVYFPPVGKSAEILKGSPEAVVTRLVEIIQKKKGT
jgi:electron transfer flavoprotein beta subunit